MGQLEERDSFNLVMKGVGSLKIGQRFRIGLKGYGDFKSFLFRHQMARHLWSRAAMDYGLEMYEDLMNEYVEFERTIK